MIFPCEILPVRMRGYIGCRFPSLQDHIGCHISDWIRTRHWKTLESERMLSWCSASYLQTAWCIEVIEIDTIWLIVRQPRIARTWSLSTLQHAITSVHVPLQDFSLYRFNINNSILNVEIPKSHNLLQTDILYCLVINSTPVWN